jgi:integrase
MEAYQSALDTVTGPSEGAGVERTLPGSISTLCVSYYRSSRFTGIGPKTQRKYRLVIDKFRAVHGHLPVSGLEYRHIVKLLDQQKKDEYSLRRVLRLLLTHAVEHGWRKDNPMAGMRRPRKTGEGFRPWSEDDIARFEAYWPTGTRQRLALHLLLYTAQRRSDVVTMGRQHVKDGRIAVAQAKSGGRTNLWIPIHRTLQAEIDQVPRDQLTFVQTQYGQPFSPAGFTNWFTDAAQAAGLPPRSAPHGLRKAAARRLAEAGCSANEIMSITGHKNLSEVATYTASADQERLADRAMKKAK